MARIKVKLDEVESSFELYPEDTYHVRITERSKPTQSREGNPTIRWIGEILDGDYTGKLISWNTSLLPQSLWVLKAMLEAIDFGWDEDGFEMEEVFGHELLIDNVNEEFDDIMRNKITGFHSAG